MVLVTFTMVALLTGLLAGVFYAKPAAAVLLAGFENQKVASVPKPIDLAFDPDGRMLIASQPGRLRVYKNGQLLPTPALDISGKVCSNIDRGLLGVTFDPNFATNRYVYVFYTHKRFGVCPTGETTNPNNPLNRVSRFVMSGDTLDPASEEVLIDNVPTVSGYHNGGDLGFGNDITFSAPAPEDLSATGAGNYLEIRLTATDSRGLTTTVTQELQPRRVDVSFQSQPSGLSLQVNGQTFVAPRTLVSWANYKLNAFALSPQTLDGAAYAFASWSDKGKQGHPVLTGAQPSAYSATYKACATTGTPVNDVIDGTLGADTICGMGGGDVISGRRGNNVLEGMDGDDEARGGAGTDKVVGGTGDDALYSRGGNDSLNSKDGVSGNDSLDGGAGTDTKVTDNTEKSVVGFP